MREHGFRCRTVQISVRDNELFWFERQAKLTKPSYISNDIEAAAMQLFHQHYHWNKPIRSIGVRATDLIPANNPIQVSLFEDEVQREKYEVIDKTVDSLRTRFGHFCIQRASVLADRPLCGINPKGDHIIHPVGYFKDGMMK
jgi:DNA polymerase-4